MPAASADERRERMYEQIGYSLTLLFLGILALYDIRWKTIPTIWIVVFGIAAVVYFAAGNGVDKAMICVLPGMALLFLAFLTGEQIGFGDGMVALVIGFFLGGGLCTIMVSIGIMMTGIFSLYRLMRGNKEPVPLIPFFLAAMEGILIYV